MNIIIDEKILYDDNISLNGFMSYIAIKSMQQKNKNQYCVSIPVLYFNLHNQILNDLSVQNKLRAGLNELITLDVIVDLNQSVLSTYKVVDIEKLLSPKNFIMLHDWELYKICNSDFHQRFALLRFYCILINNFNSKHTVTLENGEHKSRVVCDFSTDYLEQISGHAHATTLKYINKLEEMQLISVYRPNRIIPMPDGSMRSLSNVISRYEDREYLERFVKTDPRYVTGNCYPERNADEINHKRRMAQRIVAIRREKKNYSQEELQEAYQYAVKRNQLVEKDNVGTLIDLSLFDGLLINEKKED